VTDNPNINADCRHQALAAGCDGIPFHKDKNASSGWPFVITAENCPTCAYRKNQHQHMFALAPSDEIRYDVNGHTYVHKRDPPNVQCVLMMLVDELLTGQDTGFPMRDFSRPVGDPEHNFLLKVILLFFMGDYPGQSKIANMMHAGVRACHWCHHDFEYHSKGHNVARDTRQHLPPDNHFRTDDSFPAHETRAAPATRTHAGVCAKADELAGLAGPALERAQKACGVYGLCVLRLLYLFNVVWDITGDMMHLMKGMWHRRVMPMLKGDFKQAHPKLPETTRADGSGGQMPYTAAEMTQRMKGYDAAKLEWTKVKQVPHDNHANNNDHDASTYKIVDFSHQKSTICHCVLVLGSDHVGDEQTSPSHNRKAWSSAGGR
jgi:hypothetical protein